MRIISGKYRQEIEPYSLFLREDGTMDISFKFYEDAREPMPVNNAGIIDIKIMRGRCFEFKTKGTINSGSFDVAVQYIPRLLSQTINITRSV